MNFIFGLIFSLTFILNTAHAFTVNSSTNPNLKGWSGGEVTFYVNTANCPAGVDVVGIVEDALKVWNKVPTSSLKVKYGGSTTATTSSNPPIVYCEVNFNGVTGADNNSTPAAASINTGTGQITTGFLVLNVSAGTANISNNTREELTIIMTHEIGHVLGLGHSQTTSGVMYYTYSLKTALNLAQDDIDGISYLYPKEELDFAGCGLVKTLPPPSHRLLLTLFALMLMPLCLYARLRRRILKKA